MADVAAVTTTTDAVATVQPENENEAEPQVTADLLITIDPDMEIIGVMSNNPQLIGAVSVSHQGGLSVFDGIVDPGDVAAAIQAAMERSEEE